MAANRKRTVLSLAGIVLFTPVLAADRASNIAMAVALLEVAEENCAGGIAVDQELKTHLMRHFHEYDIGGLASAISGPLNIFYEDFSSQAKSDRLEFCRRAPDTIAGTGYPALTRSR